MNNHASGYAYAFDFDEPEGKVVQAVAWDQHCKAEAEARVRGKAEA